MSAANAHKRYAYKDIAGQKFGRLTALSRTEKRTPNGSIIWLCRCECGSEVEVSYNELCHTSKRSCGCLQRERSAQLHTHLTHVAGTSVDILRSQKIRTDNTTGVKGVYFIRGRYVAKIVFQKRQYYLGAYDTLEKAAEIRLQAEETLAKGTIDHYEKWRVRADSDPLWAEENPIAIHVMPQGDSVAVCFLPIME